MRHATRLRTSPLEALVGRTPLVDVSGLFDNDRVRVLAKAEWTNPGGSVKDRAALRIVQDAESRGDLDPSKTLLDATSGNTGISFAWLGAAKGFAVRLCMSDGASDARKNILRTLGAELELTDPQETTDGAIRRARHLAADEPGRYYYANQYDNPSNPAAHETTTGPEIWEQTAGKVTHIVAGMGTTGTIVGLSRYFATKPSDVRVVGVEPDGPLHGLEGLKHLGSAIVPGNFDPGLLDERLEVSTEAAYEWCRRAARRMGLFVGVSSGAALAACERVAQGMAAGTVVTILPDNGQKYLGEPFWAAGPPHQEG